MRSLCILTTTALLMTACGGGSGGGATPSSDILIPELITQAAVEGMLASNDDGESPTISGDGLVIACQDESGNAVFDDTNRADDILRFDILSGTATHVSGAPAGQAENGGADNPALDQDGSHCAFESRATNVVPGDTNDLEDIFLHDGTTGVTTRVSVASDGSQALGGDSGDPSISADGTVVAFWSDASNLVANDTNGVGDIFVHDTTTGTTTRVSVNSAGAEGDGESQRPRISADGNLVVFDSRATNLVANDANARDDVFVHNRTTGITTRVSLDTAGAEGDDNSSDASISADGTTVVFESNATNLVAGDTNGQMDVFAHIITTGTTLRVSVDSSGNQATGSSSNDPAVNASGRYVAFSSNAANLVTGDTNGVRDIFRHDITTGTTVRVNVAADGSQVEIVSASDPDISDDGTRIVFDQSSCALVPDDRRVTGNSNILMKDLGTGAITLATPAVDRSLADGDSGGNTQAFAISRNGRFVVFASLATNLVAGDENNRSDLFIHDRDTGVTSVAFATPDGFIDGESFQDLSVSNDGRFVCFESNHADLLGAGLDTNDTNDVFVVDTVNETIELASVHTDGTQGNNDARDPRMSPDGRYVVFESRSTNLIDGDLTNNTEIFLRDRTAGTTSRVVFDKDGGVPTGEYYDPSVSDDGRFVSFETVDDTLVDGDMNATDDIIRRDVIGGTNLLVSRNSAGEPGEEGASDHRMSGDGNVFAWSSTATNLVPGDTNGLRDTFLRDVTTGITTRASVSSAGTQTTTGDQHAVEALSGDGTVVLFQSNASDLVPSVTDTARQRLYAHHRLTGQIRLVGRHIDGGPSERFTAATASALSGDGRIAIYSYPYREITGIWLVDLLQIGD